jgi:SAM-dependent methyltransferase
LNFDYSTVESKRLKKLLPHYCGQHLIQFGAPVWDCLQESPILHKIIVTPTPPPSSAYHLLQSTYFDLPLASESIDLVIMPHILEFEPDPKAILAEVWRVLMDHGHLFIISFNPYSSLGLWHLCKRSARIVNLKHFYSLALLRQWINNLGGLVQHTESFMFRPPLKNTQNLIKLTWMERVFPWIIPYGGNIHLLIAEKRNRHLQRIALSRQRFPLWVKRPIYVLDAE